MDKKPFDFKDLMAFGMFILALLTFVFSFIRQCFNAQKNHPGTLASERGGNFYVTVYFMRSTPLWAVVPFVSLIQHIRQSGARAIQILDEVNELSVEMKKTIPEEK